MRQAVYSKELEDAIAEYVTGRSADRDEKVQLEIYTKQKYAHMFFDFTKRYIDISGIRFLEIGCGTGCVAAAAAERSAIVTATDYVQRAVDLTRRRIEELKATATIFASDLRAPFHASMHSSFDFVWCFQVLEHIPRSEQFKALSNILDCADLGGYVFIDTENRLCPFDRHDTGSWLLRYLSKDVYDPIFEKLGWGVNFHEPSSGEVVQTRDYMSFDELGSGPINRLERRGWV